MCHEGDEAGFGSAVPEFRGPLNAVVGLDDHAVLRAVQEAECQMKFAVPAKPAAVVIPVLVEFGEQGNVALTTCSPVAELDLTEVNVELAFAHPQQRIGRWGCRISQGLFFCCGELGRIGLPEAKGVPS